ncbi:MAG: hypothetical protein LQ341_005893 [Variospora aurantia]|nr:MAG: hypothetical protein LQ341_005893 [Variospora aurantia]
METVPPEYLPHGLLLDAYKRALVVRMNDIQFQQFSEQTTAIGTYALRACSVVIVASRVGAIVAHVAPLGDDATMRMMDEFKNLYQTYRLSHFGAERHPWVVTGLMHTGIGDLYADGLPDMTTIINERLMAMGLQPSSSNYKFSVRIAEHSPQFPGKGTVMVDAANDQLKIYVEDQLVHIS